MIYQQIKSDSLTARKARDVSATFLVTLASEIDNVAKSKGRPGQATDDECIAVIKKFQKGSNEILKLDVNNASALMESEILAKYLPKQLTEDEIRNTIAFYRDSQSIKTVGEYLKNMKQDFAGQYDGALAAKLAKEVFK
jgi:uncharacterized protein YqeY